MIVPVRSLLFAALVISALLGCAAPGRRETNTASIGVPYTVERVQRDLAIGDEVRAIRIVNPHGNVAIRNTQQRSLGVRAVVQKIGVTPESASITLETRGGTALLEVAYASDSERGTDAPVAGHRKGRADLAVFLPPGLTVDVQTTYGKIDVRRIDNDVIARTRDGMLVVVASGFLRLATDSGDLRALPMSGKASGPFELTTRSGNIAADVPLYGEIALTARTGGRLTAEEDLGAQPTRQDDISVLRKVIGSGTQRFDVRSDTGDIYLAAATQRLTK